jgi:AcrR family transcriptional regulator
MTQQPTHDRVRARPGGRNARIRQAVLDAALAELAAVGYGSLSVEAVADRAGVHKTTVYRRWDNLGTLVVDAMLSQLARDVPTPDTGTVVADLRALLHAVVANITSPGAAGLLRALVGDAGQVPEIRDVGSAVWEERFAAARTIIGRGVERGELPPDTDADLMIEALIAPLYLRLLVTDVPIDPDYADRVLDLVLRAHGHRAT